MMRNYESAVIPQEFVVEFTDAEWVTNPFNTHRKYPPLTFRGRMRLWYHDLRWAIHDRVFPDCSESDD